MRRDLVQLSVIYVALLVLLALTTGSAFLNLGHFNTALNLAIAVAKAALVYWFFMELRTADGLARMAALGVIFWLLVLLCADAGAWLTRAPMSAQ
jgi:cytochrome c oxidase subunit 4